MFGVKITEEFLRLCTLHVIWSGVAWSVVFIAILLDLWDKIYTVKVLGEVVKSNRLRVTLQKTGEYWRFYLMAFFLDIIMFICFYKHDLITVPYACFVCAGILLFIEFKSLYEHAKKRKSNLANITDIAEIVVKAATAKDAKKAIEEVRNYLEKEEKK